MKQTNAFAKGIAALVCAVLFLGAGTLPAKAVSTIITRVWVTFDSTFAVGNEIPYTYTFYTEPDTGTAVIASGAGLDNENLRNGVIWYDLTEGTTNLDPNQTHYFQEDHRYKLELYLRSNNAYVCFGTDERFDLRVMINKYIEAEVKSLMWQDLKYLGEQGEQVIEIIATYEFTVAGKLKRVELPEIPAAVPGEAPSFQRTGAYDDSDEEWYIDYSRRDMGSEWIGAERWYDETAGKYIDDWDTFQVGHIYQYSVAISARGVGAFQTKSDGLHPDVRVRTQDGIEAASVGPVLSSLDDDGLHEIFATFRMECTKIISEIQMVTVTDVTLPIPGKTPTYFAAVPDNADYEVEYYDAGNIWHNGVSWEDVTDGEMLSAHDTFKSGHVYRVSVSLVPKSDGYIFPKNEVSCTVNGWDAEYITWNGEKNILVNASFKCEAKLIHIVYVGFNKPIAGQEPDWNMTVDPDANYEIENYTSTYWKNGVLWRDETENHDMKSGDRFIAGHQYRVTVSVVTKDGYEFEDYMVEDMRVALGDAKPDEIMEWEDPKTNIGLLRYFTLPSRIPGDASADGKVNMKDALTVVQYMKGKTGAINLENADVNGDGKVTIEDARLIGQYAAGWNVTLK